MNEEHNPWTILDQKKIYENPWIELTEFQVINPIWRKWYLWQGSFQT